LRSEETLGVFEDTKSCVVTPLSVVDLPESYKDALAGVTATFHKFSANFIALGSFREGFPTNNKRHRKWSIP